MNYESKKFAAYRDDKHLQDVVSVCIGSGKFLVTIFFSYLLMKKQNFSFSLTYIYIKASCSSTCS